MNIGRKIIALDTVESTNDTAKRFAESGEGEGLVVTARGQTSGRGRQGRAWVSSKDQAVILSALLRPDWPDTDAPWLGVWAGIATARVAADLGVRDISIKWPNDVLVRGKKLAGVLVEPRLQSGRIEFAIVGIGLNVRQSAHDWPDSLRDRATSLLEEGCDVTVGEATRRLVTSLDRLYGMPRENWMREWSAWSRTEALPVLD